MVFCQIICELKNTTRLIKIATQSAAQMASDKEAVDLSREHMHEYTCICSHEIIVYNVKVSVHPAKHCIVCVSCMLTQSQCHNAFRYRLLLEVLRLIALRKIGNLDIATCVSTSSTLIVLQSTVNARIKCSWTKDSYTWYPHWLRFWSVTLTHWGQLKCPPSV